MIAVRERSDVSQRARGGHARTGPAGGGEIVTHRFGLDKAEEAVKTSMADGAMKVVIGAG
jgi:hypothetical protein